MYFNNFYAFKSLFSVVLFIYSFSAFSNDLFDTFSPTVKPEEDKALFKGVSAKVFFENRNSSKALEDCRERLKTPDLSSADYFFDYATCGPCAIQATRRVGDRFVSHGSCQVSEFQGLDLFSKFKESFITAEYYTDKKNGIPALVLFEPRECEVAGSKFDCATEKKIDRNTKLFHALIAVGKPGLFQSEAFAYFAENRIEKMEPSRFQLRYMSRDNVKAFPSEGNGFTFEQLKEVQGMWYATQGGYIRYFTEANFGPGGFFDEFAIAYADNVVRETMHRMVKRAECYQKNPGKVESCYQGRN